MATKKIKKIEAVEITDEGMNIIYDERIICPVERLYLPSTKIVVVVAETPNWTISEKDSEGNFKKKGKKLECGRAAAQAAHAVSKLKLSYTMQLSKDHNNGLAYSLLGRIMYQPITTIVTKARDTEELIHIRTLAQEKKLHVVHFYDTNRQFYGTDESVLTAIAIGPYTGSEFDGITDYLPLWKCACDLQG